MKDSTIFKKYEKDIQRIQDQINGLTKQLGKEKREFVKIGNLQQVAKENTRKTSSLNDKSSNAVFKRRKIALNKEASLKITKASQHNKIKKLTERIQVKKSKVRQLRIEQKAYSKASTHFQKEWRNFIKSKNKDGSEAWVSYKNKVISAQVRAARSLLKLSKQKFADALSIEVSLLSELEQPKAKSSFQRGMISKLFNDIERLGVELIDEGFHVSFGGAGARLNESASYIAVSEPNELTENTQKEIFSLMRKNKSERSKVA